MILWQPWLPTGNAGDSSDVSFNELPARQQAGQNKAVRANL
jgi:hypothetical protein